MKRGECRNNFVFLIVMFICIAAAVLLFLKGNDVGVITSHFADWEADNTGSVIPVIPWVIIACAVVICIYLHVRKK